MTQRSARIWQRLLLSALSVCNAERLWALEPQLTTRACIRIARTANSRAPQKIWTCVQSANGMRGCGITIDSDHNDFWNISRTTLDFSIVPDGHQAKWFFSLCAALVVILLQCLYQWRVRHLTRRMREQLEERLEERERIARVLHDTLLQGMQGLILRFQAASERISPHDPAREMMESALDRADEVLVEGRDRVKDSRESRVPPHELHGALTAYGERLAAGGPIHFTHSREGAVRSLHTMVAEEARHIICAALMNAFQHTQAQHIELHTRFERAQLRILVRDNGRGIDAARLAHGTRPGRGDLADMRRRAQTIHAEVNLLSSPTTGTTVELCVPAAVAYRSKWCEIPPLWFRH